MLVNLCIVNVVHRYRIKVLFMKLTGRIGIDRHYALLLVSVFQSRKAACSVYIHIKL